MTPEVLLSTFREAFGEKILSTRTVTHSVGRERHAVHNVWIEMGRETLHDAVAHLTSFSHLHLSVISGDDLGEAIAFNYHFAVGFGERFGEVVLTIRVVVPKGDLRLPTLTDLIPGALTSEREKQEFFGVVVEGIPDPRHLFLPQEATFHPWRKDEAAAIGRETRHLVDWETPHE